MNHASFQEGVVPLGGPSGNVAQTFAPMGLLSLAGAAGNVADVQIADINKEINRGGVALSERFYEESAGWLLERDPDLVGFMTEADSYHHVLAICRAIKTSDPSTRTLLGGPHASAVAEETLQAFPAIDYIIRGEGEVALPGLISSLHGGTCKSVGNLTYRDGEHVVSTPSLPLIQDLDSLPWPDFERIDLSPDDGVFIEIGRGCPFKCNFCFTAPYWHRKHRIKSPARIISELRYLKDTYGLVDFNFTHDLFTTRRRWVLQFCRELVDSALDVTWTCSSRTDTIDEEQIEWMARAGCRNIYYGVETGTPEMQARIDKNLDLTEARGIIESTTAAGIGVTVGFIAGLPGESAASLRGTLGLGLELLALPDSLVHLFGYSPYRGSANYERIQDRLRFDPHFVDFPLGRVVHQRNCRTMKKHLPIFSRYSWPTEYHGLDQSVVRAAEEFFPLVNALRNVILAINERDIDALDLLTSWAGWIERENRSRGIGGTGLHRGAIGDMLRFLAEYAQTRGCDDPPFMELVSWETIKNELREERRALQNLEGTHGLLRANETLRLATFRYAPTFEQSGDNDESRQFAFYIRRDGSPSIVRLDRFGQVVLSAARAPLPKDDLLALLADPSLGAPATAEAAVIGAVAELEELDLLVPAPSASRSTV